MNIGVITICTGKYDIFFNGLYESLEKYFLNGHKKTYYVFTDGSIPKKNNIVRIQQEKLGWPHDTMKRFHMFKSIKNELENEDFLYFFNANMKALAPMGEEVIPKKENNWLMGAHHPGFFGKGNMMYPYDRNPKCSCYIPNGEGKFYVQGCFNGGRTKEWLEMSSMLSNNIDIDEKNGIIPLWHDESEINWYYKDKNPLILPINYIYPESWDTTNIHEEIKMIQLDKNKYGSHKHLRG